MTGLRVAIVVVVVAVVALALWQQIKDRGAEQAEKSSIITRGPVPTLAPIGPLSGRSIGLVIGHWNREAVQDVGAICETANGELTLTELEINEAVAELLVPMLEERGAKVWELEELDPLLRGFTADLTLSIHADSCVRNSGFKAASHINSGARERELEFIQCLQAEYAASTNLTWDEYTITPNMTYYHVHDKVHFNTPSVILEMGFLGGDQRTLLQGQDLITEGILNSILCYMDPEFTSQVSDS